MAKKRRSPYNARLSAQDIGARLTTLGTKYTQNELATKLGISRRSLNYYQSGHNLPNQKATYDKINKLYNKEKTTITDQQIGKRETKRRGRSETQQRLKMSWHHKDIFPTLVMEQGLNGFRGLEILQYLEEKNFRAGWFGTNEDVQQEYVFYDNGHEPAEMTKYITLIGVAIGTSPKGISRRQRRKKGAKLTHFDKEVDPESEDDIFIIDKRLNTAVVLKIAEMDYFQRMDALRAIMFNTPSGAKYTIQKFLGYALRES